MDNFKKKLKWSYLCNWISCSCVELKLMNNKSNTNSLEDHYDNDDQIEMRFSFQRSFHYKVAKYCPQKNLGYE